MKHIALFILILSFILAAPVSAQFVFDDELDTANEQPTISTTSNTTIEISPAIPSPNTSVTATVRDFSIDLARALIVWYVDGTEQDRGVGKTTITFQTKESGSATAVRASINPLNGSSRDALITVRPGDVDIVWTANTYTPPWYRGKALYSPQSSVTLAAIPQFPSNENLIYTWRSGNVILGSRSGADRNTLLLSGSLLGGSETISVEVTNATKTIKAADAVTLTPQTVDVVIYGDTNHNAYTGRTTFSSGEKVLEAVPYYISSPNASYSWSINGRVASNSNTLPISVEAGQVGSSQIDVSVKHVQNFLQSARESLVITFR